MNVALWILQVVLGLAFVAFGGLHTFGFEQASSQNAWMRDVGEVPMRLIGIAEILGGIGVIAPAATRILPQLTPLAAGGIVVLMISALIFHAARGEWPNVAFNAVLAALAAVVVYGRSSYLTRGQAPAT